jgi:hypothetical protein
MRIRNRRLDLTIPVGTQSSHYVVQLKSDLVGLESLRPGPGYNHDVPPRRRDLLFVMPEPLPQTALDAISAHGVKKALLHHQAQSVEAGLIDRDVDTEVFGVKSFGSSLDSLIFIGRVKPLFRAKPAIYQGATLSCAALRNPIGLLDG